MGIHSSVLEIVQAMVKAIVRYYMHNNMMFSLTHLIHHNLNLMCVLVLVSVVWCLFCLRILVCLVVSSWDGRPMLWDRIHSQVLEVVRENLEYLPTLNIEDNYLSFSNSCVSGS